MHSNPRQCEETNTPHLGQVHPSRCAWARSWVTSWRVAMIATGAGPSRQQFW